MFQLGGSVNNYTINSGAIIFPGDEVHIIRGVLILNFKIDPNKIREVIETVETKGKDVYKALIYFTKTVCHRYINSRSKRGLINVGGKLLKVLFGTATTDQIDMVEKQLTIQSKEINDLHHFTVAVSKTFETYQSTLNLTLNELESLEDRVRDLTMAEEALSLCQAYDRMITDAKHQELDLAVFNLSRIEYESKLFSERFGYKMIVPITQLKQFQKTIRTTVIGNHILLTIFFEDPEEISRHVKISPFPMLSNSSMDHKFQLEIDHPNIIISRKSMGIVDSSYLNSCLNVAIRKLICKPYLKFPRGKTNEICEYNLITRSDVSTCKFQKIPINSIQLIETSNETIVSGVPGDIISLSCLNKRITYFPLPSSGIGVFAPTCSLNSKLFAYDVMEKKQVDLEYFDPIAINKNLTNHKLIDELINKVANEKLPSLEHFSIPHGHSIVSFWGTCFSILLILSFFVVICVCRGKLKDQLYGLLPARDPASPAAEELLERPPSASLQAVVEGQPPGPRPPTPRRVVLEV